jgi:hypothetical protein
MVNEVLTIPADAGPVAIRPRQMDAETPSIGCGGIEKGAKKGVFLPLVGDGGLGRQQGGDEILSFPPCGGRCPAKLAERSRTEGGAASKKIRKIVLRPSSPRRISVARRG